MIENAWYIAEHSSLLGEGGILGRSIAGHRLVLFRTNSGEVNAFADSCPHRRAPLSLGRLVDGEHGQRLRCPYHGLSFDSSGKCVHIPGQEQIPPHWRLRAYPVIERHGYVWVWVGDPDLCSDFRTIPAFLEYGEPPYVCRSGVIPVQADYVLLVDNLLDATHADFVHKTTFGASDWQSSRGATDTAQKSTHKFDVDIRKDGIHFEYRLKNTVGGPAFRKAYAISRGVSEYQGYLDITMVVDWQPPGLFSYLLDIIAAGSGEAKALRLVNLHLLTPEEEYSTHYFFRSSVLNTNGHDEAVADYWRDIDIVAFHEDKLIIEAQQRNIGPRDLFSEPVWTIAGDQMSVVGRRILKKMQATN